jgi:hypothetical protein
MTRERFLDAAQRAAKRSGAPLFRHSVFGTIPGLRRTISFAIARRRRA